MSVVELINRAVYSIPNVYVRGYFYPRCPGRLSFSNDGSVLYRLITQVRKTSHAGDGDCYYCCRGRSHSEFVIFKPRQPTKHPEMTKNHGCGKLPTWDGRDDAIVLCVRFSTMITSRILWIFAEAILISNI